MEMVACAVVDHPLVGEVSEAREALEGILADLRAATTLKSGWCGVRGSSVVTVLIARLGWRARKGL